MLLQICLIAKSHTKQLLLVGGCVRDMQLGKTPNDYDLVVDGNLDNIAVSLEENGWQLNEAGKNFFVLIASKFDAFTNQLYTFEIAMFRKDGTYVDGRRPEYVDVGTIEEDALRRDFTINSLYYDPFTDCILDPTKKGLIDISNKVLRFNGKARERIEEDALRIFRMYRFAAQLKFEIEANALKFARRYFNEAYEKLSPERVRLELEKIANIT